MIGVHAEAGTTLAAKVPARSAKPLTNFHLAIVGIALVATLAVVPASLRMPDRAIGAAVAQREAAGRFLAGELSVLRIMAMTSESPVPARLYLGIEECFQKNVAVPFDGDNLAAARHTIALCAEMELGRLHSQGGAAMADKGRAVLRDIGLTKT
jgi:hypothetical protein